MRTKPSFGCLTDGGPGGVFPCADAKVAKHSDPISNVRIMPPSNSWARGASTTSSRCRATSALTIHSPMLRPALIGLLVSGCFRSVIIDEERQADVVEQLEQRKFKGDLHAVRKQLRARLPIVESAAS